MRKIERKEFMFKIYELWKDNLDNEILLGEFFVKAMENKPKCTIDDLRYIEDHELLEALEQYNKSIS